MDIDILEELLKDNKGLIKMVQDRRRKIETLEKEIVALKKINENLKKQWLNRKKK
jgi:uncharacterized protein YaaN involved in tellurite resistance